MIKYIFLLITMAVLFFLVWMNREHPKIQETIIVVIVALIVAIAGIYLVSDTSKSSAKKISTVYFLSNKENKPLFFTAPVLTHYHLMQNLLYSEDTRNDSKTPDVGKLIDRHSFFCDLQAASLLNHLLLNYSQNWFIERVKENFPGFASISGKPHGENKNDVVSYTTQDLETIFNGNQFVRYIDNIHSLALPKGTKISYEPYGNNHKYCLIEFKKSLYFDIKIKIQFSSYIVGLGNMTHFIGVSNDENDRAYGTVVIDTYCTAKFNRLWIGNPAILKYKKWADALFNDLYNTFAWQVCYEDIKDYLELTAHQAMLNDSK